MPKLAIYIPKKDMKAIEKWRKKINFSKVFMQALLREIRERSRVVDTNEDRLKAAAVHYKKLLNDSSEDLIEFGHKLGSAHLIDCQINAELVQKIIQLKDNDDWTPEEVDIVQNAIGEDLKSIDEFIDQNDYDRPSQATWRKVVFQGYVQGVAVAWQQICDHM